MNSDVVDKKQKHKGQEKKTPKDKSLFYFRQNIFDEGYVAPDEAPPAPTFSEEELEAAKKEAFESGKREGIQQTTQREQSARAQFVAKALDKIASTTQELFGEEEQREQRFQAEAVALASRIFESLYPVYEEKYGFENLKFHIESVLKKHSKTPTIEIYVSENNVEGIQQFLNDLTTKGHNGIFDVYVDKNLDDSACRLSWPQGGSYFNNSEMAEEIRGILAQTLAGTDVNSHDSKKDDEISHKDDVLSDKGDASADEPDIKTEMEKPDE